jgi:hypothetical protein
MAFEDRVPRAPQPYRPGPDAPLEADAFRPPGPLPAPPAPAGVTWLPSPPPFDGDRFPIHVRPARGRRRGTALLVPPWKLRSRRLLSGWERLVTGAGLDAWTVVPPHHLERTSPGARGGEGFVSADLGALRAALAQTVAELRLAAALARTRGGEVHLVGLSLGALAGAWLAAGPEPVDGAVLVAPPADLGAVFRETPIGRRYAALARRAGAPLPEDGALAPRLAGLAPLHLRPTARRLLLAAGEHDAIAVGGGAALARAWGLPLASYPRGHLTLILACPALRRDAAAFLRGAA